jgi:glycosyltransferase involved in cell wall biosynthesis
MIFFAGALRKLKNVDILTKGISILIKERSDLNLIIAGAGYEEEIFAG